MTDQVHVVVGVYGGLVQDVRVFSRFGNAESALKDIARDYGIDLDDDGHPILMEESEHDICILSCPLGD